MARKTSTIAAPEEPVVQPEPPEVVSEPIVTEPASPKPSRLGFFAGVIVGVVAAGAGYGVATFYPLQKSSNQDAALLAQVDDLKAQIAEIPNPSARLDQLEQAVKSAPDLGEITGAILARLVALEARPSGVSAQMQADIAALQAQSKPFDPTPAVKAAIATQMEAVQKSAAAMRTEAEAAAAQATRAAQIALMRAALDTGAPYVSVTSLADLPAILADHAETGLPSLTLLKETFPDAARLALEAALRANMGGTWAERVTNFLRAQTGARALTPREGNDPDAILSRVEAALNAADLPRALAEIQTLPPEAQTALQDWTASATLRQSAIDAVTALAAKKE